MFTPIEEIFQRELPMPNGCQESNFLKSAGPPSIQILLFQYHQDQDKPWEKSGPSGVSCTGWLSLQENEQNWNKCLLTALEIEGSLLQSLSILKLPASVA